MLWVDTAEEWALNALFCIAFIVFFIFAFVYASVAALYYVLLAVMKWDLGYLTENVRTLSKSD